ncbi:TatD family hydrolase [Porifericola rhodea]|uniref:TatD family hydrolase n=1 Tax=Porifericola rhodea TaxID=930972 RepID=UPI0026660033|nr:TatD family hydrolase [Porifericola rhodea]WKN33597.1 TatD family hydrolase [Porifericola rhodea]
MTFIDTHAHIYDEKFKDDIRDTLARCEEAGVEKIYMPNIDHTSIDGMMELEERHPQQCISMMGLHPTSVKKDFEKELYIVEEWLGKRAFAAVGEIGLDYYWDTTFAEQQKEAFRIQIEWAKKYELPIVIHNRDSFEDSINLIEELKDEKLKGIFHCFTGTVDEAQRIKEAGFLVGLGGVSTFKNANMDQVIPEIDMDMVVLETDSPYLAPVPKRGKRNEPSFIPHIAEKIAEYYKVDLKTIAERTTSNALSLFNSF